MGKPLTKAQIQLKKVRRLKSKSLESLLLHPFLNHYGYDKGEVTARAIVDDILQLTDEYFLVSSLDDDPHHLHYGQLVWMAVPVDERPAKGKSLAKTRMKVSCSPSLPRATSTTSATASTPSRCARSDSYDGCMKPSIKAHSLPNLILPSCSGVCDAVVSKYVNEIQASGELLPPRGNLHDLSGAITHKRESITLYLEGHLTPDIAMKTYHSKESVDRYIADYHRVELLWTHGITELDQISRLSRLSPRAAQQYVDLLPDKIRGRKKTNKRKNVQLDAERRKLWFNRMKTVFVNPIT